jgi:hypothetical protein
MLELLLSLVIVLLIVGLLLYVINLLPLDPNIRQIIQAIVVIFIVIWLLSILLGVGQFPALRLDRD